MRLLERDSLLEQLAAAQRQARRGQGQLALVSGEAGIGKSALLEAFGESVAAQATVLRGRCEAASPPRPLAPIVEIGDVVGGELRSALLTPDRHRVLDAMLALLGRRSGIVVVLEDLHWADDATLEVVRAVGRRIRGLPALVIGTYRDDEVGAHDPLRAVLDEISVATTLEIAVPALSVAAIRSLARGTGIDVPALHRLTAGNPFFAAEVIAAREEGLPTTVREAVLARTAGLPRAARRALDAASVLGPRWEPWLLREVADCDDRAIEACRARGMLAEDGGTLRFRHDLVQEAVSDALSARRRRRLHARALAALGSADDATAADPARLARHAVGAADGEAIARMSPIAGDRAAESGAHREAAMHYRAALDAGQARDVRWRAGLLESHARASRTADRLGDALASQSAALECWRTIGDVRREGDALQELSQLTWFAGDADGAIRLADAAVRLLEPLSPRGPELARASAALARRLATSGTDDERGLRIARSAQRLAERIGLESVAVDALISRGVMQAYAEHDIGWTLLAEGASRATAAELHQEAARALINLVEAGRDMRRYDMADRYRAPALACVEEHHLDLLHRRLLSTLAELALERGRWDEAGRLAEDVLSERMTAAIVRCRALVVIGLLAARRGDADPWPALDEAMELVGESGEAQDVVLVRAARAEAAWLDGDFERASREATAGRASIPAAAGWPFGDMAAWSIRLDPSFRPRDSLPEPHALEVAGRVRQAAARWEAIGAPYRRACALAESDEEADLHLALAQFHALGARPMARRVRRSLRESGARSVARGPRRSTGRNPALLTDRQLDVLALLGEGLSNAGIAERLVVSPKTVDHHVSAILNKLGVPNRAAAGRQARLLLVGRAEVAET